MKTLIKMDNKKEKLAIALEEEKNRLPEYSAFGENNNLENYDSAIAYLKNGIKPNNWQDNELLVSIIEDFDTMCSDYDV